jgi:hypothetical protein
MKRIKFIYWLVMSAIFLAAVYRERKISELNHINSDEMNKG